MTPISFALDPAIRGALDIYSPGQGYWSFPANAWLPARDATCFVGAAPDPSAPGWVVALLPDVAFAFPVILECVALDASGNFVELLGRETLYPGPLPSWVPPSASVWTVHPPASQPQVIPTPQPPAA